MNGVLVDTSVWIDHFRHRSTELIDLMGRDLVMVHPLVVGEIACGTPPNRSQTLYDLDNLQQVRQATLRELLVFVERERLFGLGCGLVDFLLLASTLISPGVELWTFDKRLRALAERFSVAHGPAQQ